MRLLKQLYESVGQAGKQMFIEKFFKEETFYLNVCRYYVFSTDDTEYLEFLQNLGLG